MRQGERKRLRRAAKADGLGDPQLAKLLSPGCMDPDCDECEDVGSAGSNIDADGSRNVQLGTDTMVGNDNGVAGVGVVAGSLVALDGWLDGSADGSANGWCYYND